MFKFDTHVHTSETSPCGNVTGAQTVELYHKAGYNGFCITDHYTKDFFSKLEGDWSHKIDCFLEGYINALSYGEKIGFEVLLGMEMRLTDSKNEYLIFGVTNEFLNKYPELYNLDLSTLSSLIKKEGLIIFQAHPFRPGMVIADSSLIDGVEVYNGNIRHNSRNNEVYDYALKNGLKMTSGSDCHEICDVARGGITTDRKISTSVELVEILKTTNFQLIKTL